MHQTVLQAVLILATLAVGAVAGYLRVHSRLRVVVVELIAAAEAEWKSCSKAGGQKFEWVVERLYQLVPGVLRVVLTRELIGSIVQRAFDEIQKYAMLQLDRALGGETDEK